MLIDEAPTLNDGRSSFQKDQYGKKAIDFIMRCMDMYKENLIVILAGYKTEMEQNIVGANIGFRRRIQWNFHIDNYSPQELFLIFRKKLFDSKFVLPENSIFDETWFNNNYNCFPYFGGSLDIFIHFIRICHTKKNFGMGEPSALTDEIIHKAFNVYKKHTLEK